MGKIAIIGAGSWGTALAIALSRSRQPHHLSLWVHSRDVYELLRTRRLNEIYLPGFELPPAVVVTDDLAKALHSAEAALAVIPSAHARATYTAMLPHLSPDMALVSTTKGLEHGRLLRMTEVIVEVVSPRFEPRVAVISGPTFAREVARGDPTALVVASSNPAVAEKIQGVFSGPTFRLYTSPDPVGVEIGGAVKNVVAVGAGVCHGLGLGSNAMAALITRGLAEITRLAVAMGARPQTLAGLAGLGDLVLTCTGDLSRNRTVGVELARGRKLDEITGSTKMIAEGVKTTNAVVDLGRRHNVETPISTQMYEMLHFGIPPKEAIRRLMERSLKGE